MSAPFEFRGEVAETCVDGVCELPLEDALEEPIEA